MSIIKLDAIDSTNDYLKQLAREEVLENFTIVTAYEQWNGRGQLNAKWNAEPGKNLTMSVFVNELTLENQTIFDFNITVALAVLEVLKQLKIPNTNLKWPNDIMAEGKKVGGILIENTIKPNGGFVSIVGIGINLNQTNFEDLPQATSLTCITGNAYDSESLALQIRDSIKLLLKVPIDVLWDSYLNKLFKIGVPSVFEDIQGCRFMGIIQKVDREGKLIVLREDDRAYSYEVKEIKMLF
jgi:BirA family biotin operon repressor/biotin-[acetyl-CoA-carboxylase] ligase